MTYVTNGLNLYQDMQISSLEWSGTPSLNTYLTFSIDSEYPTAFITSLSLSNAQINLPSGNYFCQAYVDYTRSATTNVFKFEWEIDGALSGHYGATDFYSNYSSDVAETAFELSGAGALRLKVTGASGSNVTLNSPHCMAYIWRTSS